MGRSDRNAISHHALRSASCEYPVYLKQEPCWDAEQFTLLSTVCTTRYRYQFLLVLLVSIAWSAPGATGAVP